MLSLNEALKVLYLLLEGSMYFLSQYLAQECSIDF